MRRRKRMRSQLLSKKRFDQMIKTQKRLLQIEKDLTKSIEDELIRDEERAVNIIKENSKFFFNNARSKGKVRCPIGPLRHNNSTVSDPRAMAEILKMQFESVFSTPSEPINISELMRDAGPRSLDDIEFTEEDIVKAVMKIAPNSSPGFDGIPALLLKNCIELLKEPIHLLWRTSLSAGKLPKQLKTSVIIPVHKGGSRCAPENYRPISLTPHLC